MITVLKINNEKVEVEKLLHVLDSSYGKYGNGTKYEITSEEFMISVYFYDQNHILIEYMPDFNNDKYKILTDPLLIRNPQFVGKIMGETQSIKANWLVDLNIADFAINIILHEKGVISINEAELAKMRERLILYPWFERSYSCDI